MYKKNLFIGVLSFAVLAVPQLLLNSLISVELDALVWIASMAVAACLLGFLVPQVARLFLLGVVLAWLILCAGVAEISAVILWLASAWALGAWVLRRLDGRASLDNVSATEAIVLGTAIWLAVWGGMIHFPVNYRLLYLGLCVSPWLAFSGRFVMLGPYFRSRLDAAQHWMSSIHFGAWVVGLTIIGWVLRWVNLPTMGYDDHAQHLRIWTELVSQYFYSFDVKTQVWAAAPFAVDLLHAGLSLMAGGDARSAMNLVLAISLLVLMVQVLHKWKTSGLVLWLFVVLFASTPMLGNQLLSLQTELALAVLALGGMLVVADANGSWRSRHVLGVLACAALCAASKLPGAILGVMLIAAWFAKFWTQRSSVTPKVHVLGWTALWVLIPLGFVALHSYAMSWTLTGNPVFPLYNAVFRSPLFMPENFSDSRWIHGFSLQSYVRVFFNTSAFFENGEYAAGWQFLFLLPIAIASLFRSGVPNIWRITLIPVLGFGLIMFSATQYWRYLFPVMPLAGILLAVLFRGTSRLFKAVMLLVILICIVLNLFAFSKISWMMRSPASAAFSSEGKENLTRQYAPVALLTKKINQLAPGSRVLYPSSTPYGATLNGTPLYLNWYSPFREARFASLKDMQSLADFLGQEKVDFVIEDMGNPGASNEPEALLREHLAIYGSVIAQEGTFLLYRLIKTPVLYKQIFFLNAKLIKQQGEGDLLLPLTEDGVLATTDPKILTVLKVQSAKQVRYQIQFSCPSELGFFVAQINWDKGPPYYRLVTCKSKKVAFKEAAPVPVGASQGLLYLTVRETNSAQVTNLVMEVH